MSRRRAPLLLLVLPLALAAGCGGNEYDAQTVEKAIVQTQKDKVRGLPLGDATCPEDVKLAEGVTFRCTIVINGVKAPFTVTLTNVDADKVTVASEPAKALIPPPVVADYVKSQIQDPAVRAKAGVTCGTDKLFVVDPGTTIGCVVTIDGREQQVRLRVKDTLGNVVLQR